MFPSHMPCRRCRRGTPWYKQPIALAKVSEEMNSLGVHKPQSEQLGGLVHHQRFGCIYIKKVPVTAVPVCNTHGTHLTGLSENPRPSTRARKSQPAQSPAGWVTNPATKAAQTTVLPRTFG